MRVEPRDRANSKDDLSHPEKGSVARSIGPRERNFRNGGAFTKELPFLYSSLEILRFSREIEEEALENPDGSDPFAGFQNLEKRMRKQRQDRRILDAEVWRVGFADGKAPVLLADPPAEWIPLPRRFHLLISQWFLANTARGPIASVDWEISPEDRLGIGSVTDRGKSFGWFATSDAREATALAEYLEQAPESHIGQTPGLHGPVTG
ncbi:MAG: hypothetical protein OXI91_03820 [Chloroflexota bacterium]|nr:hypothetical protein [Chloroflexota bacterium]